jgi:uncharacterized protein
MENLTVETVKQNGWLVFEAISGSRAYGLDTLGSDTDIKGVFVLPKEEFFGLQYMPQVNNESNDIVYYELGRYVELLAKNNPNMMELLYTPSDCILYKDPIMDQIQPALFLSKICEASFANYAYTQIKKAYGLEKKIMNPVGAERKSVADFCYIYRGKQAIPLKQFLAEKRMIIEKVGLSAVAHLKDCYNLYYSDTIQYNGLVRVDTANDVCTSSIPPTEQQLALLYFNKDGYSAYCKTYKEYWEWVGKRNEIRYANTVAHGKKYDTKNMMHVFRLLLIAKEIALEGTIHVRRSDRDFLLSIKEGKFEYEDLVEKATTIRNELPSLYAASSLPSTPDIAVINQLLVHMREQFYAS